LYAIASAGSITRITPFNVTLAQGNYAVDFGPLDWYITPHTKSIFAVGGKTQYVVGTYAPVVRVITMTLNGFNSTQITAMHAVTPVVWVNNGGRLVVLELESVGSIPIQPSANYTMVFPTAGTFNFDQYNTTATGFVQSI
jgi:hypothetical protein